MTSSTRTRPSSRRGGSRSTQRMPALYQAVQDSDAALEARGADREVELDFVELDDAPTDGPVLVALADVEPTAFSVDDDGWPSVDSIDLFVADDAPADVDSMASLFDIDEEPSSLSGVAWPEPDGGQQEHLSASGSDSAIIPLARATDELAVTPAGRARITPPRPMRRLATVFRAVSASEGQPQPDTLGSGWFVDDSAAVEDKVHAGRTALPLVAVAIAAAIALMAGVAVFAFVSTTDDVLTGDFGRITLEPALLSASGPVVSGDVVEANTRKRTRRLTRRQRSRRPINKAAERAAAPPTPTKAPAVIAAPPSRSPDGRARRGASWDR